MYEKALTLQKANPDGVMDSVLANTHHHIAIVKKNMKVYKAALEHCAAAVDIRTKVRGPEHPDVATSLHLMGSIHEERNQGSDQGAARQYFTRALGIRESKLGADHPDSKKSSDALRRVGRVGRVGRASFRR